MIRGHVFTILTVLVLTCLGAGTALAAWCGENGTVRFSFSEGPELQPVGRAAPDQNGLTVIDLYAWLTDVQPVEREGREFEGLAAFEMHLAIEGAEGFITKQEYSQEVRQVGKKPGNCIVGLYPGLYFTEGAVQLVHWQVMFQGEVKDVVFRLDPEQLITCERTPGCEGSGVSALYTGIDSHGFIGEVFGAGHQAAYLNPTGEPDLSEHHGQQTWQQVGRFVPVPSEMK